LGVRCQGVYRIVDVVGVSEKPWEDAGRIAVETAAGSLRDLRIAEVTKLESLHAVLRDHRPRLLCGIVEGGGGFHWLYASAPSEPD
jgi:flavin-binding protein dodecin